MDIELETQRYERLYREVVADISNLDLRVEDIRDAVDVAQELMPAYAHRPYGLMRTVSQSLERNDKVDLKSIKWLVTSDRQHSFGSEKKKAFDEQTQRQPQRKMLRYEKALIEAAVTGYEANPRIAVEIVDTFIQDIRRTEPAYSVDIIKMPFDVDSTSRMVGQGLEQSVRDTEAKFSFVLIREEELP
jgi:hypothetical protein